MSLLKVNNLHTYFETNKKIIKAVQGVSFTLEKGKTLGILGESGSGKSQTAMSILKLFAKNQKIHQGEIIFNNQIISDFSEQEMQKIRGKEIAIIFQDPVVSLNPSFKIKNQIIEILICHQLMTIEEALQKTLEILKKLKINDAERVMELYPHQLSGGMCQRIMIAMALVCEPKILISDEATTALDVIVQKEILSLMKIMQKRHQTSILFITHDLGVVSEISDDVIVMYKGKIVEKTDIKKIFNNPLHPYTKSLLANFLKTGLNYNNKIDTNFFSAENKVFDFFNFKNYKKVDPDFFEVNKNHFISCNLKK
ncbi:ABC-type dipeptide/oligopeptide transport system, ATPase component II [Candidatus Phytoplasma mali]|uniref:ABC-type dipeptide/oligopeptide transport system, ATPase component II n=1 Tax=Phytoplasma mali (strain AT) TaxID=482235 RepID=B3R087_PHYMT|nr:ABC transporter ATP-binding protein [Candidatus Phytoplasma mali]CAP18251.1 ABC-type dipeptide/oligopeptide transport system, ATPase component II [Candidatus Phytoplasma mali]